jgi:hypothetical protein
LVSPSLLTSLPLPSPDLSVRYGGLDGFRDKTKAYVSALLIHALSLFVFSFVLLGYGFHISHKLSQSYEQKPTLSKEKVYLLFRINLVLAVCCLCYLLRAVLFSILAYEELNNISVIDPPSSLWFLVSAWIPTVGPVSDFLPPLSVSLCLSLSLSVSL